MQDLLNKGCLSFKGFCEVYNKQDHDFTAQEAWIFTKELGLAFPVVCADVGDVGDNKKDPEIIETVMIPCLMERPIKDEEKTLCLMYKFNRNTSTIWIYNKLLKAFTKRFLVKNGGTFDLACSQKIGKRRLGTVREIRGTCMWTNRRDSIREPKQYSFLFLEHDQHRGTLKFKLNGQPFDGKLKGFWDWVPSCLLFTPVSFPEVAVECWLKRAVNSRKASLKYIRKQHKLTRIQHQ